RRALRSTGDRRAAGTACAACAEPRPPAGRTPSEVASFLLLALDRLEQRLEVALAEPQRTMPLDQFKEHRRPVTDGLSEDLQQVTVFVAVYQNAALLEFLDRRPNDTDASAKGGVFVVRVRSVEER